MRMIMVVDMGMPGLMAVSVIGVLVMRVSMRMAMRMVGLVIMGMGMAMGMLGVMIMGVPMLVIMRMIVMLAHIGSPVLG